MSVKSPRFTALELLNKMDKQAYSNLILDAALNSSGFSARDKGFVSRLFYGAVERKLTLEYVISLYSSKPLHKLDGVIVNILKIGLYQILYMDAVPDNAAVNESVTLAKQSGKTSASGFVNAVLRNFIRDGKKIKYPTDKIERLSVEYSCGIDLVKQFCSDYSYETAEKILKMSVASHGYYLRVNSVKTNTETVLNELISCGYNAKQCSQIDNCIIVESLSDIENNDLFKKGYFHVQDLSSQLCCKALNPKAGETLIDLCAAPGGKAFTLTEMMNNEGRIYACDLHQKRVNLIKKGAERLGLTSINAVQNDAKLFNSEFPLADKVLCDVPCSGFGVIRSKPEIKYADLAELKKLPEVQYDILCTASRYLKQGGELVYSTCTLSKAENDRVIDRFLEEHSDFEPVNIFEDGKNYKKLIFPDECEGFFISKIRKAGK